MKNETRTAVYDQDLRLEACRLRSVVRPFPSHFQGVALRGRTALPAQYTAAAVGRSRHGKGPPQAGSLRRLLRWGREP